VEPDLRGAILFNTNLQRATLHKAKLSKANIAGANFTEANLQEALLIRADLTIAKFSRANLSAANLLGANLRGAILYNTKLSQANLQEASLQGANLQGASLQGASLFGANLQAVNLDGANLAGANISGASLIGANFTQARMSRTIIADVDLHDAQNLDTVVHSGPSTIGIDTLYRSGGEIPEVFLRGCGVPDPMIEYARALVVAAKPIQYYSVFISYSSADEEVAKRLYADLQAAGVRCWFAPEDLKIGDSIFEGIDQAIRLHEKLLIILSAASMASRWVQREVRAAQVRELRDGRTVLFPVRIDETVRESSEGWAAELWAQRHIGDFCTWKEHDAYQRAFARLIKDLQATPG
jgi:hypothetical protein